MEESQIRDVQREYKKGTAGQRSIDERFSDENYAQGLRLITEADKNARQRRPLPREIKDALLAAEMADADPTYEEDGDDGTETRRTRVANKNFGRRMGKYSRLQQKKLRQRIKKSPHKKLRAVTVSIWLGGWLAAIYTWQLFWAAVSLIAWTSVDGWFDGILYDSADLLHLSWVALMAYDALFILIAWGVYGAWGVHSLNTGTKQILALVSLVGFAVPLINFFPWMVIWMVYVAKNPE